MRRLAEEQRARVEELARDEGTTCAGCASARLGCGKRRAAPAITVDGLHLWCVKDAHLGAPTNTSRFCPVRSSAPRDESYSPECAE